MLYNLSSDNFLSTFYILHFGSLYQGPPMALYVIWSKRDSIFFSFLWLVNSPT